MKFEVGWLAETNIELKLKSIRLDKNNKVVLVF